MISSAEEFVALRGSEVKDEYDRAAMEEAPISVWREVIEKFPEYRRWVAHNKTVPVEILEELCVFDDVRYFVASKRKLSQTLFERLSQDPNSLVRGAIAANRKAPIAILEKLLEDESESVVSMARYNFASRKPQS
ncbi:hypothetical protein [Pseudomonas sp. NPDC087817]|uniref:hypothetical protein n=1 Tax=Pseudomonas sp. NPDC087817 TaxID=3364451 RepID=UPI00380456D5